jgi:hypothetical protein
MRPRLLGISSVVHSASKCAEMQSEYVGTPRPVLGSKLPLEWVPDGVADCSTATTNTAQHIALYIALASVVADLRIDNNGLHMVSGPPVKRMPWLVAQPLHAEEAFTIALSDLINQFFGSAALLGSRPYKKLLSQPAIQHLALISSYWQQ